MAEKSLQTLVILTFALIIMKIKTPKVRFGTETVQASNLVIGTAASGFNMSLAAKLTVENTNFGHYKFDQTTGTITYEGVKSGQVDRKGDSDEGDEEEEVCRDELQFGH
ncbi:hypothetical protein CK203_015570 [Vitis vinifera]|uniref:Late embryogenesis abundant protein LEA-2 subgroup domain-containing protein n=1 Tax=Vitis vinifera TaxID=29760 RepID=A0A438J526_VITVI|nr:hypothetical protein CK203_015570 [Vitis vinifera]